MKKRKQSARFAKRIFGSKIIRASVIVLAVCGAAIWVSDSKPQTKRELAQLLFDNAEPIAIASAAAVFLLEIPDRQKAEQYEAWQVINSAMGQTGSGGRIQALEDLNKDGVDLEGVAVPRADLSGIDLGYGKLQRVNFKKTQLDNAKFQEANLSGANLSRADLRGADLRGADLRGTDIQWANLHQAHIQWADLTRANLSEADLYRANLSGTNLYRANLSGANLVEANLRRANFKGADLKRADLQGADLQGADLKEADLRWARWDAKTTWPEPAKDRNIPEALKQKLGITDIPPPPDSAP